MGVVSGIYSHTFGQGRAPNSSFADLSPGSRRAPLARGGIAKLVETEQARRCHCIKVSRSGQIRTNGGAFSNRNPRVKNKCLALRS